MRESNIEQDNKPEEFVTSDNLTQEQKKMIESRLKNALLRALMQMGGEIVLIKPSPIDKLGSTTQRGEREIVVLPAVPKIKKTA